MRFEFLPAFKGDCFLIHGGTEKEPVLILVDGGPAGTYRAHLEPRLMALRDARELDDETPLVIDLVIVSHVDDDHIRGVIDMFEEMHEREIEPGRLPLFEVRGLWHNSFDEIIGNSPTVAKAAQFGAAAFGPIGEDADEPEAHDASLILQSVSQGHRLRELAIALDIPLNDDSGVLIQTRTGEVTSHELGGIKLTIVGPRPDELAALQKAHDDWLEQQRANGRPITPGSLLQSLTDESVANLSSIVLLAERDGRKALLTGDARSDFVVKGLEEIGLLQPGGEMAVDLLKMPHHGSDRNVDEDFLTRVTAPAYLFTGNGEHGNPERETFRMLVEARPDVTMDLYLTYDIATIDAQREHVHNHERRKELDKQGQGKKRPKSKRPHEEWPRAAWSAEAHSLAAFVAKLPASIRVIEPESSIVEL